MHATILVELGKLVHNVARHRKAKSIAARNSSQLTDKLPKMDVLFCKAGALALTLPPGILDKTAAPNYSMQLRRDRASVFLA